MRAKGGVLLRYIIKHSFGKNGQTKGFLPTNVMDDLNAIVEYALENDMGISLNRV